LLNSDAVSQVGGVECEEAPHSAASLPTSLEAISASFSASLSSDSSSSMITGRSTPHYQTAYDMRVDAYTLTTSIMILSVDLYVAVSRGIRGFVSGLSFIVHGLSFLVFSYVILLTTIDQALGANPGS
jgi:hypothetical protein